MAQFISSVLCALGAVSIGVWIAFYLHVAQGRWERLAMQQRGGGEREWLRTMGEAGRLGAETKRLRIAFNSHLHSGSDWG